MMLTPPSEGVFYGNRNQAPQPEGMGLVRVHPKLFRFLSAAH